MDRSSETLINLIKAKKLAVAEHGAQEPTFSVPELSYLLAAAGDETRWKACLTVFVLFCSFVFTDIGAKIWTDLG